MESAVQQILIMLGSVSSVVSFLVAITVLVLGLVIVRPLNNVAGIIFAVVGAGQLFSLGFTDIVWPLVPQMGDMETLFLLGDIRALIRVCGALFLYAGVMFGSIKLATTNAQRAAQW